MGVDILMEEGAEEREEREWRVFLIGALAFFLHGTPVRFINPPKAPVWINKLTSIIIFFKIFIKLDDRLKNQPCLNHVVVQK